MFVVTAVATAFLLVAALLPFLPLSQGIVRIGDFPRQQMAVLAAVLLAVSLLISDGGWAWVLVQVTLAAVVIAHMRLILAFTPLWRRQSVDFDKAADVDGESIRLLAANVKMSNSRYHDLEKTIAARDPDIVVLMEVDDKWKNGLARLLAGYRNVVDRSQDNSYGMIMATRLAVEDLSVGCLLTEDVPSIIATLATPKGQRFRLYCIHPEPPVPHATTAGRDGETSLVALKVRHESLPVMVTGDLNDVAWSRTTERFRRISGLLDPRVGRMIFSTFDARYPLVRWPLDHLFHSAHFRLADMQRLPASGSDHFPVMFELVLCHDEKAGGRPAPAARSDIERARELAAKARQRDDAPIGTDWEK